ncbi:MAG: ABC transporter C-terminal domain-containing protein [Bilophila wadsworthia]
MWPATSWISSLNRTGSGFRYTRFPAASVTACSSLSCSPCPPTCWFSTNPPTIWMWKRWNCLKSCSPAIQGRCSWSATTASSSTTSSPPHWRSKATGRCASTWAGIRTGCASAPSLWLPTPTSRNQPLAPPAKIGPRKLTFKEQRELQMLRTVEALPGKMAALEDEQHTLEDRLNDPGFFARDPDGFNATAKRISELDDEQTAALQRWEDVEFRIAELEGKAEDK